MFGIDAVILSAASAAALGKAETEAGIKPVPFKIAEDKDEGITAGDLLLGAILIDAIDGD